MNSKKFTLLFVGLIIVIGILSLICGLDRILQMWNIPTMNPIFADIRTIAGVPETLSKGLDPLVNNPGDPWNRTMNYPRIWQYLAELVHLNQTSVIYFGFINILLFLVGFLMFITRIELSKLSILVLLLAFLSPASVLAMERANIDIVMFFILSLSLFYISRPIVFSGLILFASFLKIFPIFALAGLLRERKSNFFKFVSLSVLIFSGYVLFTLADIILIKNGTPQSPFLSYGINIVPTLFARIFNCSGCLKFIHIGSYLFIACLIAMILYYLKRSKYVIVTLKNTKYIDAFRVGSSIFLLTFLLGSNWDYRLIFLIFTIPQLILWTKSQIKTIRLSSQLATISILITMWFLVLYRTLGKTVILVDEFSNWVLFSSLLLLFTISLPDWIFEALKINTKFFSKWQK